ncbi:hypothetical protein [Mucilaginibacter sp.]|jgi:hypothetical protein|uniref:hypothetical protein n=1 Tax=Mucilaginibacter sp. TaxID=1882438 RepID=UPI003562D2C5
MNLISEQLQLFVSDSLDPQKFAGHHISNKEFEGWKVFLTKEIAVLKHLPCPFSELRYNKRIAFTAAFINQIVDLSNLVNFYLNKLRPIWKDHPQADQIKANYIFTCNALEELITSLLARRANARTAIKISHYNLPQVKMQLKERLRLLTSHLNPAHIDEELKELVLTGFSQLITQKDLRTVDQDYFNHLSALILKMDKFDTRQLMDLLITNDFNLAEFFHYCINYWRNRMSDIPGLHEQQEMLLIEKDMLYNLHIDKGLRMPDASSVLYDDLSGFLSEKYQYVKQLLRLRREAAMDTEKARAGVRFLMNLPVPQFGLFIRMQIEKGLLPKEKVGELFSFFALHFYTPHTLFISAESLQKKSTNVEFSTAQKMKSQLIGMLNWLNTNFNLSNYN